MFADMGFFLSFFFTTVDLIFIKHNEEFSNFINYL